METTTDPKNVRFVHVDVWLDEYHAREAGYDLRVNVMECSEWSENP